jgi:hypothetical protein
MRRCPRSSRFFATCLPCCARCCAISTRSGSRTITAWRRLARSIHGERCDWITRIRVILDYGESKPFEPFDRYAMYEASKGKTIVTLLDEFDAVRRGNLLTLETMNLTEADFARRGTHPALGTVTLGQLLATWPTHDLNHIHQIAKCMAWQYRDDIGPWKQYMGVLANP